MKRSLLIILPLLAANLQAQWSSDSTINNPICTAADNQRNPQLTTDGNGGAIIVWEDRRTFSNQNDLYAQLINSDGYNQWANDGISVSTETDDQVTPQLISDGNGGAIIVWQDNRTGNADIYAQRIDNNGVSQWAADGIPICTATSQQFEPQIINDGNGGAIVTWKDYRSGFGYDIYAQRVDANGNTLWTSNGIVICSAVNEQSYQQIINDSNGDAIIVWQDKRSGAFDIYAQKIDTSGTVLWATDGVRVCIEANDQWNCQLLSDEMGGAYIVWRDIRNATDWDIYAQRINQNGSRLWDTSGVAVCLASEGQFSPQIVSDFNGGAIICWEDYRSGVSALDIFAQRIDGVGNILWNANGVEICIANYNQKDPQLVSDETGTAIIVWQDHRRQYEDDIYAQRINSNGNVLWMTNGAPISVPARDQRVPQLNLSGNYGAIITWEDFRDSEYDIYASLVDTSGNLVGGSVDVGFDKKPPYSFELFQNYPNPFNPSTKISWQTPVGSHTTLIIYNVLGHEVATLVDEYKPAGTYEVEFEASQLSSGIYFYRLSVVPTTRRDLVFKDGQAGSFVETKKMLMIK